MNVYELVGRVIVTVIGTMMLLGIPFILWLWMLGYVWGIGPMR